MALKKKPLKKTRDLEKSRKEILDAAFNEVYTRGFQGVSVDEIVKKTSLTKGAFYHQFPTKLDLGYALVTEVIQPMIAERWLAPLEEYKNPLDGILQQMKSLMGNKNDLLYGCPLNNLVQEMSAVDKEFHMHLKAALNFWIDGMESHLRRAKKAGYLKPNTNTKQVSTFIVMAHEGFYGILKGLNDSKSFDALFESLKDYFKTIAA